MDNKEKLIKKETIEVPDVLIVRSKNYTKEFYFDKYKDELWTIEYIKLCQCLGLVKHPDNIIP